MSLIDSSENFLYFYNFGCDILINFVQRQVSHHSFSTCMKVLTAILLAVTSNSEQWKCCICDWPQITLRLHEYQCVPKGNALSYVQVCFLGTYSVYFLRSSSMQGQGRGKSTVIMCTFKTCYLQTLFPGTACFIDCSVVISKI